MKSYFECNLPKTAPKYITGIEKRKTVTRILKQVHSRMDKLNEALSITGIRGEQFAAAAKIFFDRKTASGAALIDLWDAAKLAEQVMIIAPDMDYCERYEWPNAIVVVDTAFLSTSEWEAVRMVGIGGSDAAVTMGVSPYRAEQELYHDKVGTEIKLELEKKGKQFIFDYGHCLEPLVIDEFCRRTGAKVIPETRMFAKRDMPYITANIDGILIFPDDRLVIFEAKTTTNFNRDAWADNKVPVQYIPQCRQYMSVLDDERITGTYIGCIYGNTPNDYACSYIERDVDKEQEQLETEKEFWENNVLKGIEPEPSGKPEEDIAMFRKIMGPADTSAEPIQISENKRDLVQEYLAMDEERKALDKKSKSIKEAQQQLSLDLIHELGTVTKGELHNGGDTYVEVSYMPKSSTTVDKERLQLVYPDVYEEVVSVNPEASRIFSIKVKKERKKKEE